MQWLNGNCRKIANKVTHTVLQKNRRDGFFVSREILSFLTVQMFGLGLKSSRTKQIVLKWVCVLFDFILTVNSPDVRSPPLLTQLL